MGEIKKYSIPLYENGIKTKFNIDGFFGDEKYNTLLSYGDGTKLPDKININVKK